MRKLVTVLLTTIALYNFAIAQCPGVVLDSACYTARIGSGGGICKDSLANGMVGHTYSDDVSFVMPPTISITTPITSVVELRKIQITGISGLPAGLSYQCNKTGCEYYPYSGGDALGGMRICGTPIVAGEFTLTVNILADVYVRAISSLMPGQAQTYTTKIRILPDTSGGVASFTISPMQSKFCDTARQSYDGTVTSRTRVDYSWNFDNGNTSTVKTPPQQTFAPRSTPYKVSLRTTMYALRITRIKVNGSTGWSGDIEELTTLQNPDFIFCNSTTGRCLPERSDNKTPEWTSLRDTINPTTDSVNFILTDKDTGPPFGSVDDICANGKVSFNAPGSYARRVYNGSYYADFTIDVDEVPFLIFNDTFTLNVYLPMDSAITATSSDSLCAGDSTWITCNYPSAGYTFQWFNDTADITGATDTVLKVMNAGTYGVRIINNESGCSVTSTTTKVYSFANPPATLFIVNAGSGQLANSNFPGAGFTIVWYKDGVVIPGASSVLLPTNGDGAYSCMVYNTNNPNCSRTSAPFLISGVQDLNNFDTRVALYPNPNNGSFTINFETEQYDNNATISIKDVTGREVYHNNTVLQKGSNIIPVTNVNLANGVYVVRINTHGVFADKRFIIAN